MKGNAQVVVDIADPPEEEVVKALSLLERLHKAPQKIFGYVLETTGTYVAHVLGLVKTFWPSASLGPLADGMAADCSESTLKKSG